VRKKLEQLKLTENTDLSRDIKRLRDEMDDAKRKLELLETAAAKLAGRADETDSRLEKIETATPR
jgi:chromosome segregation ATPase